MVSNISWRLHFFLHHCRGFTFFVSLVNFTWLTFAFDFDFLFYCWFALFFHLKVDGWIFGLEGFFLQDLKCFWCHARSLTDVNGGHTWSLTDVNGGHTWSLTDVNGGCFLRNLICATVIRIFVFQVLGLFLAVISLSNPLLIEGLLQKFELFLSFFAQPARVLFYFWPEVLNMVDFRNFVRLKRCEVIFPDGSDHSSYAELRFP